MRAQLADVNALGEVDSEDEATNKHLTFNLSDEVFALPVGRVSEIVGIQQITPVPLTDSA
jgi:chemotaxis signal transduction protein